MNPLALIIPAVVFFTALLIEVVLINRARRRLGIVVRVTGTRGKSSVTRMIHSILRDAGYVVWGKTTGTEARRILPDGGETLIPRVGPGNIREQRNTLVRAVRDGADALVLECNALRPALMIAAGRYIREDVLVITNVRDDHRAEQGSPADAATAMVRSMAPGAVVITTDRSNGDLYRRVAGDRRGRCIIPGETGVIPGDLRDLRSEVPYTIPQDERPDVVPVVPESLQDEPEENVTCALAVAEHLGIPRSEALRSIREYRRDPGRFSVTRWTDTENRRIIFADALAANDPESTEELLHRTRTILAAETPTDHQNEQPPRRDILVIAHRRDRPERTLRFVRWALGAGWDDNTGTREPPAERRRSSFFHVVVFGRCPLSVRYLAARAVRVAPRWIGGTRTGFSCVASLSRLERFLATQPPDTRILLFGAGNWQGYGAVLREWAARRVREDRHGR